MISRLQDCELYSGCKRREKINDKTKSMDINKFLRLKVYTKVKSFGPALTLPPYATVAYFCPSRACSI